MDNRERKAFYEAMALHFSCPVENIKRFAANGDSYAPWVNLCAEFYRIHPRWTPQEFFDLGKIAVDHEFLRRWTAEIESKSRWEKGFRFLRIAIILGVTWAILSWMSSNVATYWQPH